MRTPLTTTSYTNSIHNTHRCSNMPDNLHIELVYSPHEVQWYLKQRVPNDLFYLDINLPISYCPHCGIELDKSFPHPKET